MTTALMAFLLALAALLSAIVPAETVPEEPTAAVGGTASWYPANGLVGAMPDYRWGDPTFPARVCHEGRCVTVTVNSFCECIGGSRVIDLSDDAFRRLAPLSVGLIRVSVEYGGTVGPRPTPPSTDVGP